MMMKTPAITNQYGEMYTGMPNGRASTIPGPASRRCGCFCLCGVVLATIPMLRALLTRGDDPPDPPADRAINVGAVPYGSRVEETAAVLDVLPGSPEAEAPADKPRGPALS